jgi:hypothetical protein
LLSTLDHPVAAHRLRSGAAGASDHCRTSRDEAGPQKHRVQSTPFRSHFLSFGTIAPCLLTGKGFRREALASSSLCANTAAIPNSFCGVEPSPA